MSSRWSSSSWVSVGRTWPAWPPCCVPSSRSALISERVISTSDPSPMRVGILGSNGITSVLHPDRPPGRGGGLPVCESSTVFAKRRDRSLRRPPRATVQERLRRAPPAWSQGATPVTGHPMNISEGSCHWRSLDGHQAPDASRPAAETHGERTSAGAARVMSTRSGGDHRRRLQTGTGPARGLDDDPADGTAAQRTAGRVEPAA